MFANMDKGTGKLGTGTKLEMAILRNGIGDTEFEWAELNSGILDQCKAVIAVLNG